MPTGGGTAEEQESAKSRDPAPFRIFINYRRDEAGGYARLLWQVLSERFDAECVFLDIVNLQPGVDWLKEIRTHGAASGALVAVIGTQWSRMTRARNLNPAPDHVVSEIEAAFRLGIPVIPAMVNNAAMPDDPPKAIRALLGRQKIDLRPEQWDKDVEKLIETLEELRDKATDSEQGGSGVAIRDEPHDEQQDNAAPAPTPETGPRPDEEHYALVAELLTDGDLVTFLGPDANSCDREGRWREPKAQCLPDADELAAWLAEEFNVESDTPHLAEVSQYVALDRPGKLYKALTQTLTVRPYVEPTSVHQFLAGLPSQLRGRAEQPYQLIVTSNYDNALEKAFDEVPEPYDLAVYMNTGNDRGHFVHVPHDGDPIPIRDGNKYGGFQIDQFGELSRSVIVKIHGAVDRTDPSYPWAANYVVTEDDYIRYLSSHQVESVVPSQILAKLRTSNGLFLGYTMRDWNLRVFFHRIFGQRQENTSWAIQQAPVPMDKTFWWRVGVELFVMPLKNYVSQLGTHVQPAEQPPVERGSA